MRRGFGFLDWIFASKTSNNSNLVCDVSCSLAWYCTCTYVMSVMSCETCFITFKMFSVMHLHNLVHHHYVSYRTYGLRVWWVGTPFLSSLKFVPPTQNPNFTPLCVTCGGGKSGPADMPSVIRMVKQMMVTKCDNQTNFY